MIISILNSDYRSPDTAISKTAVIEFLLVQLAENCSFARRCGFEPGETSSGICAGWKIGNGVRIISTQSSQPSLQNSFTGEQIYSSHTIISVHVQATELARRCGQRPDLFLSENPLKFLPSH